MLECGFGPVLVEFLDLVQEFITLRDYQTQFKDNRPGYNWAHSFLKRHKLSLKKVAKCSSLKKNFTSDSFVIYEFYETLAKEVEHVGITDKPEAFYKCDESGFPVEKNP